MRDAPQADTTTWPWILLFATAFTPLAQGAALEKFFSADGAAYFQWLVEGGLFTDFAWARNHAVYFVQWPLVLAIRAGVTDWTTLKVLFGFGLLLPMLLGFAGCLVARRGLTKWPLLFPIASLLVITLPADYLFVGEHHVLVALAWPILFVALRPARLTAWEIGLTAVLLVVIMRAYESALFVSPILALAFVWRIRDRREPPAAMVLLAALCLMGAGIAAVSILNPRDPANRSAFLQSIVAPARRSPALMGVAFLMPFAMALWPTRQRMVWLAVSVSILGALPLLGASGAVPGWPGLSAPVWAGDSFSSRTLSMTLLPLLLVAAAVFMRRGERIVFTAAHLAAFALLIVTLAAVGVYENRQWIDFRSSFKTVLTRRDGLVPIESTPLVDHPAGWPWNNAILSYLWSEGAVRAVVLNRSDVGWEPFDPRTTAILERYRQPPAFLIRRP